MARKKTDNKVLTAALKPEAAEPVSTTSENESKIIIAEANTSNEGTPLEVSKREKIALLAYSYWEQRGCRGGSPEEDWYRAERDVDLVFST
jgi:hypothetical protein